MSNELTPEELLRQAEWLEGLVPSMPDYAVEPCQDCARECRKHAEELVTALRERAAI